MQLRTGAGAYGAQAGQPRLSQSYVTRPLGKELVLGRSFEGVAGGDDWGRE
jgi:hypothetical protein